MHTRYHHVVSVSLIIIMTLHIHETLGQLVVQSDCVCPGHELKLECTVVGGVTTVWRGSALSGCSNNEIVLLHSRGEAARGECNNGAIVGRSIRQVGLNYTSQLIVHLDATLRGKSLECVYDDGLYLMSIGNYTIFYPSPRDPYPPSGLHLAVVNTNRLTFSWSSVLMTCPSIGYNITSMDCGVCPNFTLNTTVNCTITTNHTNGQIQTCTLSIQSIICGNYTGNQSNTITVKYKVPGVPEIVSILPYYSNEFKHLTRLHIQITMPSTDFVNTSEGSNLSTTSHTATLCYDTAHTTNGTDRCIINTIPTSSCSEGECQFEFDDLQLLSHDNSSAVVAVRAYSSNIIGNGLESGPIVVATINEYLQVRFDPLRSRFSCLFAESVGNGSKSCNIVYGLKDPVTDESNGCFSSVNSVKSKADNTTNSFITDTVTVYVPTLAQTGLEICFFAIGTATTFSVTVAVEGIFMTESDASMNYTLCETFPIFGPSLPGILATSVSLTAAFVLVSTIFIIVVVLLARSRARALRQLESLRESTQRGNVTYEEINLPPVDIDTSKNVAYGHVSRRH